MMKWRHTLAIVAAITISGSVVYAIAPFATTTLQMPEATDMGKCPAGVQAKNCMDNVAESPTWHYMDGGTVNLATGGGGGGSVSLTCGSGLTCSPSTITGTGSITPNAAILAKLATANTWTASQNVASVALTDGATISTNAALGNSFGVTPTANRTMANPTGLVSGGTYQWEIIQDSGGSRLITWDTTFTWPGGSAPTLQVAPGAKDLISCYYDGTSLLCGSLAGSGGGGGGGGGTGNYVFTSNSVDLTGAATMAIAPATATAVTIGGSGVGTTFGGNVVPAGHSVTIDTAGQGLLSFYTGHGIGIAGTGDPESIGNFTPDGDSTEELGGASLRWKTAYVGVSGSLPTCDATTRGGFRTVFAASSASDTFQVCMKAAADTYAWRTVFTAP